MVYSTKTILFNISIIRYYINVMYIILYAEGGNTARNSKP